MADQLPIDDWYDPRFDPYMTAVGRIATTWAALEFSINQAIWEISNVEAGIGACVTAQLVVIGPRLRALTALVHYRGGNDNLISAFNRFGTQAEGLSRQRNRYVHDSISIDVETAELKRTNVTADRRLDFAFHAVDLKDMQKLHQQIRATVIRFDELVVRALSELPPFPRTQYGRSPVGIRRHRKSQNNAPS